MSIRIQRKLLTAVLLIMSVISSCLPQNKGSNLFEAEASEEEVKKFLLLVQNKTGVKAVVSTEGKFRKVDLDRIIPLFEAFKVSNKEVFSSVGEILIALSPLGQMVPYQVSYLANNKRLSGKILLRYSVANIPKDENAAKFQSTTLGLATISKELEGVYKAMNVGKDVSIKTGIKFSDPRFVEQRVKTIIEAIRGKGKVGQDLKNKINSLRFGSETKLSLMLNLEGEYKEGTYYESKFSELNLPTNHPRFVADMANSQSITNLLNSIQALYTTRDRAENSLKSRTQGIRVHLSFGKSLKQTSTIQALGSDSDLINKIAFLKKHTEGLSHVFIVDRLPDEPARVDVRKEGVFIGLAALKSSDPLAAIGGFVALGKRESTQSSKYRLVVSTPGSPSTFRVKAINNNNQVGSQLTQSDGRSALKSFDGIYRKAHRSADFVDFKANRQILLEVEYSEKSLLVKQKLEISGAN